MSKSLSLPFFFAFMALYAAAPASAQIFRPPVPAAQAQQGTDNANAAFNNEVSAQGGAPQAPSGADDGDQDGMNPMTPSVGANFSQASSGTDLPPPNDPAPPSQEAPAETPQEQATAQAVRGPQMQKQDIGPAQYQGSVSSQNLNPAANAGT
ncbi:hypothetical protein FAI41_04065 [Acetobacteraceae bacterium]|nr:hypothetical protein FAI41_04065 [Acetobacteraceae bacterium]